MCTVQEESTLDDEQYLNIVERPQCNIHETGPFNKDSIVF